MLFNFSIIWCSLIALLVNISSSNNVFADSSSAPSPLTNPDCIKTCIDVYTDDNQLIITAQKGGKKTARPAPTVKPKPKSKPSTKPKPPALPRPKPTAKPIPKPSLSVPTTQAESLSDRLVKLLPAGNIKRQPAGQTVVNVPTIFWTNTPTKFNAVVPILDVVVIVNLYPTFTWDYGDGGFFVTTLQGAPYPLAIIKHTYQKSGDYKAKLRITWKGTYSVDGVTMPITGNAITQTISEDIEVVQALARFNL